MEHGGQTLDLRIQVPPGRQNPLLPVRRKDRLGFMVIFGKEERRRLEEIRPALSDSVCRAYDAAQTYRDGKWVMFQPVDRSEFEDYLRLLALKRKPNRS